jgi:hypothetical protein
MTIPRFSAFPIFRFIAGVKVRGLLTGRQFNSWN